MTGVGYGSRSLICKFCENFFLEQHSQTELQVRKRMQDRYRVAPVPVPVNPRSELVQRLVGVLARTHPQLG